MKLRRLITRRRTKWTATILTVFLSAVFLTSIKYHTGYWRDDGATGGHLLVSGGAVWFGWWHWSGPKSGYWPPTHFSHEWSANFQVRWLPLWEKNHIPAAGGMPSYSHARLGVPLWPPVLLLLVLSAYLWRVDRRAKPWQCAKCRYDLRGLEDEGDGSGDGAVCPECGLAIGEG